MAFVQICSLFFFNSYFSEKLLFPTLSRLTSQLSESSHNTGARKSTAVWAKIKGTREPKRSEIFVDLSKKHINPDGSIVDSEGCLWNAEWGSSKCTRYDHQGNLLEEKKLPVSQITCPALGGENLQTLYVTSASTDLNKDEINAGCVFYEKIKIKGQKENRIILD